LIKRFKGLLLSFILCVCLILTLLLPCSKFDRIVSAFTESENEVIQTLINPNLTTESWVNINGGKTTEVSNFTPFDFSSETRLQGNSIVPTSGDKNTIENKSYRLLGNGGISKTEDVSIGIWIYFSDISIHGLSIKLIISETEYVSVSISKKQLVDLCKKTEQVTEQAFAWNYLEIPLSSCIVTGDIYENNKLKEFKFVNFSYMSGEILVDSTYAEFRFYGLYLQKSTVNNIEVTEKQDYTIYSFNFWNEEKINQIVMGDTIESFSLANAINYAWVGELNLLSMKNLVSWQIALETPNGNVKNYNFGDKISFPESGAYTISYKATSTSELLEFSLYDYIEVYVRSNNLIYFNYSNYKINQNESITLTLKIDEILDVSSIQIESIEISDENIAKVVSNEGNDFVVIGGMEGETQLAIKIKAKRHNNNDEIEYQAKTIIKVENESNSNNQITIIFLIVVLGIIMLVAVVFAIRTIIVSRRNDVR